MMNLFEVCFELAGKGVDKVKLEKFYNAFQKYNDKYSISIKGEIAQIHDGSNSKVAEFEIKESTKDKAKNNRITKVTIEFEDGTINEVNRNSHNEKDNTFIAMSLQGDTMCDGCDKINSKLCEKSNCERMMILSNASTPFVMKMVESVISEMGLLRKANLPSFGEMFDILESLKKKYR